MICFEYEYSNHNSNSDDHDNRKSIIVFCNMGSNNNIIVRRFLALFSHIVL